jgi:hypothetical protein
MRASPRCWAGVDDSDRAKPAERRWILIGLAKTSRAKSERNVLCQGRKERRLQGVSEKVLRLTCGETAEEVCSDFLTGFGAAVMLKA